MTTKPIGYKTPAEEYPELDMFAQEVADIVCNKINNYKLWIRTECPYPTQCILEMLIKKLETKV